MFSGFVLLAAEATHSEVLHLPIWTVAPFVLLLLSIAILPLVAERFWHKNRNKAIVAAALALPVALYLLSQKHGSDALLHAIEEYISFIILLWSLYTVAGGIVLQGDIRGRPSTNTLLLTIGAVLANLIGTTGASMLLIRPMLRINSQRHVTTHIPIFFIFIVSNLGGLLTPLGDPPLFLGFLRGVDFFWTLSLFPQWLVANGLVLMIFYCWDSLAYNQEEPLDIVADIREVEPLRVLGKQNLIFLAGILAATVFQSAKVAAVAGDLLAPVLPARPNLLLVKPWGETLMVLMSVLSLLATPKRFRELNVFSWGAITEVAVVFAGIFVTMVPALELLRQHGPSFGITEPWQYFWLTGSLSSFLDNAPTYLVFATMAASPKPLETLVQAKPLLLQAISCGAVFMGANTYIGNGPNFMVRAIAEENGYRMPSFFGYLAYSVLILVPVFVVVTFLFFRPAASP